MSIKLDQNHRHSRSGTQPAPNPSEQTSRCFAQIQEEISKVIRRTIREFKENNS